MHRVHSQLAQQPARPRAQRPCPAPAARAPCAPRTPVPAAARLSRARACLPRPRACLPLPRACLPRASAACLPRARLSLALALARPCRLRAPPAPAVHLPRAHLHTLCAQPNAVSQVQWLYCNTALHISLTWSQYTYCIAIQSPIAQHQVTIHKTVLRYSLSQTQASQPAIQPVYCNTLPAHPSCLGFNTISIIAIQNLLSQYNLGSSPNPFLH